MTSSREAAATARQAVRRAPDFYLVGHHKSGTTALYEMLRAHPQVFMPSLKEPRFFAPDLRELLGANGALPSSWEDYLALFDQALAGQRTGEASTSYLRSDVAAGLIARARPDARIVAILREPASFVRSLHLHLLREGVEHEADLARALANEEIVRAGRRVLRYSDHVRYVEQLRRYHSVFAREQVLVLIYEEFRADNAATLRAVQRFLGVDEQAPPAALEVNRSVRVRSRALKRMLTRASTGRGPSARALSTLKRVLPADGRGRQTLRSLAGRAVYAEAPPADPTVIQALRRRFKDEVVAVSDYLGRDLVALWRYEDIG